jgi:hypothetical protein
MNRPVLTFDRHGVEGEVAKLGFRVAGYIQPIPGRPRVSWGVRLMDWPPRSGPANSVAIARTRIIEQVEEWCASLGWIDPDSGVDVRVLTEEATREKRRA